MNDLRLTNWLLLGILVALVAHLAIRLGTTPVIAETFKLDQAITGFPNEEPDAYVHVVEHDFAGD